MTIVKEYLDKALTFDEYLGLIDGLLLDHKTTGPDQSEALYNYAVLNRQRMKRLAKVIDLEPETRSAIAALDVDWTWLTITEGWCGDAAQNIPVIEKVAAANPGIRTLYVLRDQNLALMDQYLTNGARSIPLLIAIDNRTGDILGTWGSRPAAGQKYFLELKLQGMQKPEINEKMQRWYNEDRGRSLQGEFVSLADIWSARERASLAAAA